MSDNIKLISIIICCLLAVSVVIFMKKSRMGQAIRATSQDARAAKVMGVDTEKVYAFTYEKYFFKVHRQTKEKF